MLLKKIPVRKEILLNFKNKDKSLFLKQIECLECRLQFTFG